MHSFNGSRRSGPGLGASAGSRHGQLSCRRARPTLIAPAQRHHGCTGCTAGAEPHSRIILVADCMAVHTSQGAMPVAGSSCFERMSLMSVVLQPGTLGGGTVPTAGCPSCAQRQVTELERLRCISNTACCYQMTVMVAKRRCRRPHCIQAARRQSCGACHASPSTVSTPPCDLMTDMVAVCLLQDAPPAPGRT